MAPFGASRAGLMSVAADDIPDSVMVHGFEDQDLSAYSTHNTASEAVVDDPALRGDYSLEIGADSVGSSTLYSDTGLDVYPQQGNSWAVKMRYTDDARDEGFLSHGWAGTTSGQDPTGLTAVLSFDGSEGFTGFGLVKDNRGTVYDSEPVALDPNADHVYRIEIAWYEDNTINAILYNETTSTKDAELTTTTSDYTAQGGIWWSVGNNQSTFYYDNGEVSELEPLDD